MILFYDSSGGLVYNSIPESLNQGSSKANEITIVGPFAPSSVLTIDFCLPDGKTLGHSFVGSNSSEYTLAAAFAEGGGYPAPDGAVLYAWTYSVNSALTAVGGTLAFAVTVHTSDGEALALDTVSITINNGVPNIPINPTIPQDADGFYNEVLEYITGAVNAMTAAQDAQELAEEARDAAIAAADEVDDTLSDSVKKNTDGSPSLEQTINSSIKIIENLTVDGDFNVKGNTTIVDHETLTVNDNIIVTNAGDESPIDSISGLVINTGELASDGISFKGYGIVFVPPLATDDNPNPDPSDGTVKLGLGTITRTADGLAEFSFDEGEAQTVATRDDFEDAASNIIPMWDAVKRSFVPSGKTTADFVTRDAPESGLAPRFVFGTDYLGDTRRIPIGNVVEAFRGANTPIPAYFTSSDGTPENPPNNSSNALHLYTADPTRPYHAVPKHYADESYVKNTTNQGSVVYTSFQGVNGTQHFATPANPYYIVQRTASGNITLPDQVTTPPTNVDDAISQRYGDAHYVPSRADGVKYDYLYTIGGDRLNGTIKFTRAATGSTIPLRTTDGNLALPDQVTTPPASADYAISQRYGDAHYVPIQNTGTAYSQVYAKTDAGAQTAINVTPSLVNFAIVQRDGNGNVKTNAPVEDNDAVNKAYLNSAVANAVSGNVYRHKLQLYTDSDHLYTLVIYNTSNTPFTDAATALSKVAFPTVATYSSYPEDTHDATVISSANSLSALVSSIYDTVTPLSNLN